MHVAEQLSGSIVDGCRKQDSLMELIAGHRICSKLRQHFLCLCMPEENGFRQRSITMGVSGIWIDTSRQHVLHHLVYPCLGNLT